MGMPAVGDAKQMVGSLHALCMPWHPLVTHWQGACQAVGLAILYRTCTQRSSHALRLGLRGDKQGQRYQQLSIN